VGWSGSAPRRITAPRRWPRRRPGVRAGGRATARPPAARWKLLVVPVPHPIGGNCGRAPLDARGDVEPDAVDVVLVVLGGLELVVRTEPNGAVSPGPNLHVGRPPAGLVAADPSALGPGSGGGSPFSALVVRALAVRGEVLPAGRRSDGVEGLGDDQRRATGVVRGHDSPSEAPLQPAEWLPECVPGVVGWLTAPPRRPTGGVSGASPPVRTTRAEPLLGHRTDGGDRGWGRVRSARRRR
jgi:hypothetical protein